MRPFFRFGPFGEKIVMTNDTGRYQLLTDREFAEFLAGEVQEGSPLYRQLTEKHFLLGPSEETYLRQVEHPIRDAHAYIFQPTSLFILAITNQCNNACVYCQANGGAAHAAMSVETAEKIVERLAETPGRHITIEFQGGEPLMNFDVIRAVVLKAEELLADKEIEFCLVSNLILLDDEKAAFLAAHKVSVSTSLDGPEDLHDANRPRVGGSGSYDAVVKGLRKLAEYGMQAGAIQTTTRASLSRARDIVRVYQELGMTQLFFRPLTRLGVAAARWAEIGYSPEEFLRFYREGLDEILRLNKTGVPFVETHAVMFLTKMLGGPAQNYMELRSPCGAGVGQMAFNASGDVYTCDEGRMVAEMGDTAFRIGNVYTGGYNDWIESSVCKSVCAASLLEGLPTCCDCPYQPYCGVCPVVNYAMEGSMISRVPHNDRCRVYKGMIEELIARLEAGGEDAEILRRWV